MNAPARVRMTENQLQYACVEYLHACARPDVLYCHVPNEGERTAGQKVHMWKMGLLPGWPDFQLFKDGKPYFVEFKVGHSSLSEHQQKLRPRIEGQGMPYAVVRTPERFMDLMQEWEMVK